MSRDENLSRQNVRARKLSPTNENPYQPTAATPTNPARRYRWLRPLVILNLLVFGIPFLVIAYSYISFRIERARSEMLADGPVVYHTEFVVDGSLWPILAYVAAPNLCLLMYLAFRNRSRHSPSVRARSREP